MSEKTSRSSSRPRPIRVRWWHVPSGLFALWVISSLSLTDGLFVFAGGCVVMLILALLRRRRPKWVITAHRLALSIVFGILLLEAALRLAPGVIKGELANYTHGGYHYRTGGIYFHDAHQAHVIRPGVGRSMYWNGHRWRHDANDAGFRGPMLEQAQCVFLGDSMIYGHGVDNDQTVSAQFQSLTGRGSANLGVQGYCAIQHAMQFERLGVQLRPRYVVLCSHPNDLADALSYYPPSDLSRYLAAEPKYSVKPITMEGQRASRLNEIRQAWVHHVNLPLRSARALTGLAKLILRRGAGAFSDGDEAESGLPGQDAIDQPFDPSSDEQSALAWRAHRHGIEQIKAQCDRLCWRLVIFDLGYPAAFCDATKEHALAIGARYSDAGRQVLQAGLDGKQVYLKNDGHWTPLGCRLIAEALAKEIERE